MSKFWNWKVFSVMTLYYAAVLSLLAIANCFSIVTYICLIFATAIFCTFINSKGVEDFFNNVFYSINDMMLCNVTH